MRIHHTRLCHVPSPEHHKIVLQASLCRETPVGSHRRGVLRRRCRARPSRPSLVDRSVQSGRPPSLIRWAPFCCCCDRAALLRPRVADGLDRILGADPQPTWPRRVRDAAGETCEVFALRPGLDAPRKAAARSSPRPTDPGCGHLSILRPPGCPQFCRDTRTAVVAGQAGAQTDRVATVSAPRWSWSSGLAAAATAASD